MTITKQTKDMKHCFITLALLALTLPPTAARPVNALTEEDYFFFYFPDMLATADDLNSGMEKAYYYALSDLDHDGAKECVIADINKMNMVFKVVDGDVHLISPDYIVNVDSLNWNRIDDFYTCIDADRYRDMTLRHRPLFAYDIDIARNRFTVPGDVAWEEPVMRSMKYDRMVFKPHVGNVHFVKAAPGSYDSDGNTIDLGMCYTYALDDASATKKMFRGYNNDQAVPIIVPNAWFDDHDPLQYSRWLSGEPEREATADARRIIEHYYGDQLRVRQAKWLATCEINERSFYEVIFQPSNGRVLLAFVCIAEGEVVSTRNMWFGHNSAYPDATEEGPDIDDLMWFSPDIMAMVSTPVGLELYVRWGSLEGVHYDIWREVADQFVTVMGTYHYTMAY